MVFHMNLTFKWNSFQYQDSLIEMPKWKQWQQEVDTCVLI